MGCGQGMVEVCAVKRISCTFVVKIPLPVSSKLYHALKLDSHHIFKGGHVV